jgi:hypothetical protein
MAKAKLIVEVEMSTEDLAEIFPAATFKRHQHSTPELLKMLVIDALQRQAEYSAEDPGAELSFSVSL